MSRVLVVEDEQHLAHGLRFNLEEEGYQVKLLETGEEAVKLLTSEPTGFDVLILDVMLPGQDGFAVMAELRKAKQFIPTLMLTARSHPQDVLRGFEAGADDYLTKPFDLALLIVRIKGLLRRREWLRISLNGGLSEEPGSQTAGQTATSATADLDNRKNVFRFGDKSVHYDLLELRVRDKAFQLTLMEVNVLRYLIEHEGEAVSRKTMLEQVWGLREDTDTRPIDNFIMRLRRYIEDDPPHPKYLLTVRGVGYRFVAEPK